MGRAKKGPNKAVVVKPFCYFCDREFEDEGVLVQHQLTKHFRCQECKGQAGVVFAHGNRSAMGQCDSLHGLMCHMLKVHQKELITVPNAMQGREDPGTGINIHGMIHVPEEVLNERYTKLGLAPPAPAPVLAEPPLELPPVPAEPIVPIVQDQAGWTQDQAQPPVQDQAGWTQDQAGWTQDQGWPQAQDQAAWTQEPANQAPGMPVAPMPMAPDFSAAGSPANLAQQVQQWLAQKAQMEAEQAQQQAPVQEAAPFLPGLPAAPSADHGEDQRSWRPRSRSRSGKRAAPPSQAQHSRALPSQFGSAIPLNKGVAAAFRSRSRSGARDGPRKGDGREMWKPGRSDRSPSRGRKGHHSRSRSPQQPRGGGGRGWRRSRSRDAGGKDSGGKGEPKLDAMGQRTIRIIGGLSQQTSRLWLKKQMERFGPVDICHTGNRHSQTAEHPWVRFTTTTSAQTALEAAQKGELIIDGTQIQAELGAGNRRGPPPRDNTQLHRSNRDMELTSRDLAQVDFRSRRDDDRGYRSRRDY